MNWLKPHAGKQIKAPKRAGNAKYKPIEPAPGRYVATYPPEVMGA